MIYQCLLLCRTRATQANISLFHGRNLVPKKEKHKINNEKIARSRIKLGLLLNEFGEKNGLKVSDEEVRGEVQKQIKRMPGQEKMVLE